MKMDDEHRKRLDRRLTPAALYQLTPKTNCGACGFRTCLAFATQVIVGQGQLKDCPFLDSVALADFAKRLAEQHESGIGLKRESFEKALQFLRAEVRRCDFQTLADGLGAAFSMPEGVEVLSLRYFGQELKVTPEAILSSDGTVLNPWEQILTYNYVIGGAVEPAGTWVGMESLPNSVSKIKSLKTHCEDRLTGAFAGKSLELQERMGQLGRVVALNAEGVDVAGEFVILPRLVVRVLWWDEDVEEGFPARAKYLFDTRVLQVVDLESLIFACEQLTDRLLGFQGK